MSILIKNGRVIDPANKIDAILDVFIENNKISKVAKNINSSADTVIDASNKIVAPGIIDMHVHLREPGREDKETVATATLAAAKGGVTTVLAMPNTQPAMDCPENVRLLQEIIRKDAKVNVLICGTITKGRLGKELSDIAALKKSGVYAISDDGCSVDSDELMFAALKKAKQAGLLTICHSEDKKLSGKGVINLGFNSTRLGLRGIANESEYKRVRRDVELAKNAASAVHIAHVSCRESVEIITEAKKTGIKVTCETAPHYFTLTEDALLGYDTNMKMNPPLRSIEDLIAIKQGLKDGSIDVIASDHAPHTENEKDIEFERAEFGVVGLETELSVSITELINKQVLDWPGLITRLCLNPARILGLDKGRLTAGSFADVVIISDQQSWTVDKPALVSKSKNSPFFGRCLKGLVDYTICNGTIAYQR
ncbi:MAG: dihydroorotase [Candidatus Omnitrophica bacterium]|nr:dihydroorotase [Candidatus Omnitrophota bacterium]MBU4468572.1 dihydroorotase [Candidatus Omnitrophota bacterium]MCG2708644.1 dihydroorotase [Candidatus Omnitrophota bacterium]